MRGWLWTLLVLAALLLIPSTAAAQQQEFDWEIDSFHVDYTLDGSGTMRIEELINVDFFTSKHGIFRNIPEVYKQGIFKPTVDLEIQNVEVTDEFGNSIQFEAKDVNDNLQLKIGDPDETIIGLQTYKISYTVNNVIQYFDGHDELFWDVNGDQWGVEANTVTAAIHLESELVDKVDDLVCFTGYFGETYDYCNIRSSAGVVIVDSPYSFYAFENLSFAIWFEDGTFGNPSFWDLNSEVILRHVGILLFIPVGLLAYLFWRTRGKDIKGRGVIVHQYDAPGRLSPSAVGVLSDYNADNRDITAMLIGLAIKGYIKIEDTTKSEKSKRRKYVFHLSKTDFKGLSKNEKLMLDGIFATKKKGESVKLSALKNKFYTTTKKIKENLYEDLTKTGYFAAHPKRAKTGLMVLGGIIGVVGIFSIAPTEARLLGWSLGLVLSGGVIIMFGQLMPKRTLKGVEAFEHSEGLKRYLEIAEKDRLAMMQGPESRYIGDTTAPKYTVELFERMLPYAIAFGVEKQWSSKFKDIYTTPPDWYSGNWSAFNAYTFASTLNNGVSTMGNTFVSTPSSSGGSSGFSGGGFSGGGFGGGGGGSW